MSKTSCIRHPENNRYIQVCQWQVQFCQNNHCAALLLAFFIGWHDWKIRNDQYYCRANDIAEMHGDGRPQNENAYLFFTMEDLIEGTMNFYGKNAINEAIQLLLSLNVITVHKNPNPRYHFDKTKYFQFFPAVCNQWIDNNYPIQIQNKQNSSQVIDIIETPKQDNRLTENNRPSAEIGKPSSERGQAITNTTNHTTNKINQSFNADELFFNDPKLSSENINQPAEPCPIISALIEKGFPAMRFSYPDAVQAIHRLKEQGATLEMFMAAHEMSLQATQGRGFGVNYLVKVVEGLLTPKQVKSAWAAPPGSTSSPGVEKKVVYENDFSNGLSWMGDLLD